MSHRYHPAEGDKADAVLFDYCEDCADKAKLLGINLDPDRWSTMWRRMLVTEMPATYGTVYPNEKPGYRSRNEKDLGSQLYYMHNLLQRRNLGVLIRDLARI